MQYEQTARRMSAMDIHPSLRITDTGPAIGTYRGRKIAEWIDRAGERFLYDRPAVEDADGGVPLSQLRSDEFVVAPGLIYRRAT
jgi:hypothetical protein